MIATPSDTDRLRFRVPAADDATFYLELMNDPAYHHFIGDKGIRDEAAMRAYILETLRPSFETHGFGLWLIERLDTGKPCGMCGLVNREGFSQPDLGYALLEDARGQGIGLEAARSVLAFAAEKLKLTAVPAYTHPENNRSGQLLKKLGFLHVGQIAWPSTGDTAERYEWHAA